MTSKAKRPEKFPGFFACGNHDRLKVLLENKPPTLCRSCFKLISINLSLYLGQTMTQTLVNEHVSVANNDMIKEILERLEGLDNWIDRLAAGKTKEKEGEK